MKSLYAMDVAQIAVTNVYSSPSADTHTAFYMDMSIFQRAVDSLVDFPGIVSIAGGEPTLHPHFSDMARYLRDRIPERRRRGLTTTRTLAQLDSLPLVREIFASIDHVDVNSRRQPVDNPPPLVPTDPAQLTRLFDACPIQRSGAACVTPKGAYFCGQAATVCQNAGGPEGWPLEPGWWQRDASDFSSQRDYACPRCNLALTDETLEADGVLCDSRAEQIANPLAVRQRIAARLTLDDEHHNASLGQRLMTSPAEFHALYPYLPAEQVHAGFGEPVEVRRLTLADTMFRAVELLRDTAPTLRYGDWILCCNGKEDLPPFVDSWLTNQRACTIAFFAGAPEQKRVRGLAVRAGRVLETADTLTALSGRLSLAALADTLSTTAPLVVAKVLDTKVSVESVPDTAVVTVLYGHDPKRLAASNAGLRGQLLQDLPADIYVVELIQRGHVTRLPWDIRQRVIHVPVEGNDATEDLFQKEALMNIGWRYARSRQPYEHFIFTDGDVMALRYDWWRKIYVRLNERPDMVVQGVRMAFDSGDRWYHCLSTAAHYNDRQQTDLLLSDGFAWGIGHALLATLPGFNPYALDGCGDSTFFDELFPQLGRKVAHSKLRWFEAVARRPEATAKLAHVPVDLIHVHHGKYTERNYAMVALAIEAFARPLSELVTMNARGLLEWRDPACRERQILNERPALRSETLAIEAFARHGLPWPAELSTPPEKSTASRNPVCLADRVRALGLPETETKVVFQPDAIYTYAYPWSYGAGVETRGPMHGLPVAHDSNGYRLDFIPTVDSAPWQAAIAVSAGYGPTSLLGMRSLSFRIHAPYPQSAAIDVGLTSRLSNGQSVQSSLVSVSLAPTHDGFRRVKVDFSEISAPHDFDVTSVETLVFAGHGLGTVSVGDVVFSPDRVDLRDICMVSAEHGSVTIPAAFYGFPQTLDAATSLLDARGVPCLDLRPLRRNATLAVPFDGAWSCTPLDGHVGLTLALRGTFDADGALTVLLQGADDETAELCVLHANDVTDNDWTSHRVSFAKLKKATRKLLLHARSLVLRLHNVTHLQIRDLIVDAPSTPTAIPFISQAALRARTTWMQSAAGGVLARDTRLPVQPYEDEGALYIRARQNGAWVLFPFNEAWTSADLSQHLGIELIVAGRQPPAPVVYIDCATGDSTALLSLQLDVEQSNTDGGNIRLWAPFDSLSDQARTALKKARQLKLVYNVPCETFLLSATVCV